MHEALGDASIGDMVRVTTANGTINERVDRVTRTLVVTRSGRYRKRDGKSYGSYCMGFRAEKIGKEAKDV